MTLNLAQRSFKVINFGTNPKRVSIFLLVVNSNLDLSCTVLEIWRLKCRKSTILPTPLLFRLKFGGAFLWSRSVILGSAEREKVRLISRDITSQNSNLNVYDNDTSTLQTDIRTGKLPWQYRALQSIEFTDATCDKTSQVAMLAQAFGHITPIHTFHISATMRYIS